MYEKLIEKIEYNRVNVLKITKEELCRRAGISIKTYRDITKNNKDIYLVSMFQLILASEIPFLEKFRLHPTGNSYEDMISLKILLYDTRIDKQISLKQLEKLSNTSRSTISRFERNEETSMLMSKFMTYASALGFNMEDF